MCSWKKEEKKEEKSYTNNGHYYATHSGQDMQAHTQTYVVMQRVPAGQKSLLLLFLTWSVRLLPTLHNNFIDAKRY